MPDYKKIYTRDTILIVQQAWLMTLLNYFGLQIPKNPLIFYMTNGVIEIWEHEDLAKCIKEYLSKESQNNPQDMIGLLNWYEAKISGLSPILKKGFIETKGSLAQFVNEVGEMMSGFFLMYYLSMYENEIILKDFLNKSFSLRQEDSFFDDVDKVLRNTLAKLYPKIEEYVTCILSEELEPDTIPSVEVCRNRFNHFFMLSGNMYETVSFKEFSAKHPDINFVKDIVSESTINEFKGVVAFKGIVKGRVKVIWRKNQGNKINNGDILVAPMTTPSLLGAIKKAAAVVTDEGGITCHAAIVARELKKPCIIGTKIATQVLKDGDRVEVDADKGVVRKI